MTYAVIYRDSVGPGTDMCCEKPNKLEQLASDSHDHRGRRRRRRSRTDKFGSVQGIRRRQPSVFGNCDAGCQIPTRILQVD